MYQVSQATSYHTVSEGRVVKLKEAALELEASFLAEMLKSAGLGDTSEAFGGGTGEEQFSSFLLQAQAREIAKSGGIGLSEIFFNALLEQENVR